PDAPRDSLAARLRLAGPDPAGLRYVFVPDTGAVVFGNQAPRGLRRTLLRELNRPAGTDSLASFGMTMRTPGQGTATSGERPPGDPGGSANARVEGRREGARRGPQWGMKIMARRPVSLADHRSGELLAVSYRPTFPFWPGALSQRALLLLPVTLAVAAVGGLLLFRMIARRLSALETLAGRVAAGEFDARVADTSADEIGQLGARLNEMTARLESARQRQAAEEVVKRQLLADISHELATPLTAIRTQAETMLDPAVPLTDEERRAYLTGVLDESDRMNRLIQDLLELTRLEAGAAALDLEEIDAVDLARNIVQRFRPRFQSANLTLAWEGPAEPILVRADGRHLEQVVENLLMNGLRHVTTGGTVRVSATRVADRLVLRVTDDGPGLAESDRERIFDRFYRADASRSLPGSGLGLAIAREIVNRLGGAIRADGAGAGTAFVVELPAL
ncbi:MAG TPA: HAMP domain-containing sensor histidine kinase, partial [Candidatus Eisenbacteria bacterium]